MVRSSQSKDVPRHRATQYRRVGDSLAKGAEDLFTLEDAAYGNAIGVLVVHAAIAWTDALTIAFGGKKHTGADHEKAADLLLQELGERVLPEARKKLQAILRAKDSVSYMGESYTLDQAMVVLTHLRSYLDWARNTFELRPGP